MGLMFGFFTSDDGAVKGYSLSLWVDRTVIVLLKNILSLSFCATLQFILCVIAGTDKSLSGVKGFAQLAVELSEGL